MPHLHIETYVSQYFWLLVLLFAFYYLTFTKVIPRISETFKTRANLAPVSAKEKSASATQSQEDAAVVLGLKLGLEKKDSKATPLQSKPYNLEDKEWIVKKAK